MAPSLRVFPHGSRRCAASMDWVVLAGISQRDTRSVPSGPEAPVTLIPWSWVCLVHGGGSGSVVKQEFIANPPLTHGCLVHDLGTVGDCGRVHGEQLAGLIPRSDLCTWKWSLAIRSDWVGGATRHLCRPIFHGQALQVGDSWRSVVVRA